MPKFEVDDSVVCKDNEYVQKQLTVGQEYKVIECDKYYTTVKNNEGTCSCFYSKRFELAVSASLKRGDWVELVSNVNMQFVGYKAMITDIGPTASGTYPYYYLKNTNGYFYHNELKKCDPLIQQPSIPEFKVGDWVKFVSNGNYMLPTFKEGGTYQVETYIAGTNSDAPCLKLIGINGLHYAERFVACEAPRNDVEFLAVPNLKLQDSWKFKSENEAIAWAISHDVPCIIYKATLRVEPAKVSKIG